MLLKIKNIALKLKDFAKLPVPIQEHSGVMHPSLTCTTLVVPKHRLDSDTNQECPHTLSIRPTQVAIIKAWTHNLAIKSRTLYRLSWYKTIHVSMETWVNLKSDLRQPLKRRFSVAVFLLPFIHFSFVNNIIKKKKIEKLFVLKIIRLITTKDLRRQDKANLLTNALCK